ncbi:MAG: hypothetical protein V4482_02600 [Pseudomonadota bacterium]
MKHTILVAKYTTAIAMIMSVGMAESQAMFSSMSSAISGAKKAASSAKVAVASGTRPLNVDPECNSANTATPKGVLHYTAEHCLSNPAMIEKNQTFAGKFFAANCQKDPAVPAGEPIAAVAASDDVPATPLVPGLPAGQMPKVASKLDVTTYSPLCTYINNALTFYAHKRTCDALEYNAKTAKLPVAGDGTPAAIAEAKSADCLYVKTEGNIPDPAFVIPAASAPAEPAE